MFCWRSRKQLSAYIDGELRPARARALARHLAECAGCAARERELRRVWDGLGALAEAEVAAGDLWSAIERRLARESRVPAPQVRHRWLVPAAVAASAMLGVAGGTLFAMRFAPRAAEETRGVATDDGLGEAFGEGSGEAAVHGLFAGSPSRTGGGPASREDAR